MKVVFTVKHTIEYSGTTEGVEKLREIVDNYTEALADTLYAPRMQSYLEQDQSTMVTSDVQEEIIE